MEKASFLLVFQSSVLITAFCLLHTQVSFSQDCKTQAAVKPSVSVRFPDIYNAAVSREQKPASWNITKMKPHLVKTESWVKNILTGFTGAKLAYSNDYFLDPLDFTAGPEDAGVSSSFTKQFYKATGIKGFYAGKMRFYAYYCYDNSNTVHTEAESGSFIQVNFNNVFASGLTVDAGVYTINGKPAFRIIQKKSSEGRIDFYEQRAQNNANAKMYTANDYIILRNSDKPVFTAITRKEYLEQLLKDIETFGTNDSKLLTQSYNQNIKQFEEEMKVYKAMDKTYTPEKEAKRRKWFEEDQQKLQKLISKSSPDKDASREVIMQYLKKPAEWLSRSFNNFYSYSNYTANNVSHYLENLDKSFLSKGEEESYYEIVSINPAYFNNKLGVDVPQLISVHLQNSTYDHMLKAAELVKQPGALAPLEAMLNPGKQVLPEPALPEVTSTYSLKYLPKLTKLTPLIVPADMKPSATPVIPDYNSKAPAAAFNFTIPPRSPKLSQLPQPLTTESYNSYIQQLYTAVSNAVKPAEKNKADDYVKNKNLTQSKDISNTAFAAWLQNAPTASLYLYSKALAANPSDALAANNFSAFLMMGGLPEKSVPILEYWNRQKPGEAVILSNLGNAYYRLGDVNKAMAYLQQCVQKDSLHPTANKILCLLYLKKGDTKKAKDHGTKSLTTSHDEQVVDILRELDNKIKPGEIMSRLHAKEFPLLKRIKLPSMPSSLDDMEQFKIDLEKEKKSLDITIADIASKTPKVSDDIKQQILMASLIKGITPLRVKAQLIIMDGMQTYQQESTREFDVFSHNLKILSGPYSQKVKAISKKYALLLNKLEGGEAGDEDEIAALELAKCREINAEKEKYLAALSPVINGYAQRKEFISRKFYRDYANWAPFWMPQTTISFPSIERDYLKDIANILGEYKMIMKSDCTPFEPLAKKEGVLKEWEDEYCANFKGKLKMGPVKVFATCNSWGVEGGEGIVGDLEMKFRNDGSFEDLTLGAGLGVSWNLGKEGIIDTELGVSVKEFIKIGPDKATGKWTVKDAGVKAEIGGEAGIGKVTVEEKVLEISLAVNAGLEAGGVIPPLFNLN